MWKFRFSPCVCGPLQYSYFAICPCGVILFLSGRNQLFIRLPILGVRQNTKKFNRALTKISFHVMPKIVNSFDVPIGCLQNRPYKNSI